MKVERQGDSYIFKDVCIFDEHEDDSKPDGLKRVTRSTLERIVNATSRRLASEGELPVVFNEHTPKPGERRPPPPVRGGYRNLKIGDFNGRAGIFADIRVDAADYPAAKGFQRRSVELFPTTYELDTLALLGSKAPSRDLGRLTPLVHYSRDGREIVRYEMQERPIDREQAEALETARIAREENVSWETARSRVLQRLIARYERHERAPVPGSRRMTEAESKDVGDLARMMRVTWDEARELVCGTVR